MITLGQHLYIEPQYKAEAEARELKRERERKRVQRHYQAAKRTRLNADWTTASMSANAVLTRDLRTLRARARDFARNNGYGRKFIIDAIANVLGAKGLQLKCRARFGNGKLNAKLNKRIEDKFWEWTFRENCSLSGKLNFAAIQRLALTQLVRDGEFLIQMVADPTKPFGISLKNWNVDWLDETYNEDLKNGNRVIMSVEVDRYDRPVGYWLTTPASEMNLTKQRRRERFRIPASEMLHGMFVLDDEQAVRGVTWFAAILEDGKDLKEYVSSTLRQARMSSNTLGFLESELIDEYSDLGYDTEIKEDGTPREVPLDIDSRPLSFNMLPPGMKISQFDPKQPTQNHSEFKRTQIADIAAGAGRHYFSLAGDMKAVNYSSARVGLNEERELWLIMQEVLTDCLCRPVFNKWLETAWATAFIEITAKNLKELRNAYWRGRGWRYVDPLKEINAVVIGLENGLETWTDALADRGIDLNDHLETLKQEQDLAAQIGVELKTAGQKDDAAADEQNEDAESEDDDQNEAETEDDKADEE